MARQQRTQDMIVKLFQVEVANDRHPLAESLRRITGTALDERNREVTQGTTARVEMIEAPTDQRPFWLIDFVRLRYSHGPGRASEVRPIEGFDMRNGDGFAEETAMLYCPSTHMLFAQYNHFGLKDGGAAKYFGMFGPSNAQIGYEFAPVLDDSVSAKLARADQFTSVKLKIARGEITQAHRDHNVSLGQALEIAERLQAPFIEVTIGVGHTRQTLATRGVKGLVSGLQRLIGQNADAVKKAQVTGRNSEDPLSINEVLDLVAPTVRYSLEVQQNPSDLRFIRESRFDALTRAYNAWNGRSR